jgi:RNA polymerase sigma-70 factor (ECF subfamily)
MVSLETLEDAGSELASREPRADELVRQLDLRRTVRRAIAALPVEQREVVILKEYQGLTFVEIAQALDQPVSTVKTRLYRGLGRLRLRLEDEGIREAEAVPAPAR